MSLSLFFSENGWRKESLPPSFKNTETHCTQGGTVETTNDMDMVSATAHFINASVIIFIIFPTYLKRFKPNALT